MHVEKRDAPNLGHGLILASNFLTDSGKHTVTGRMRRIEIEIGEAVEFASGIHVIQNFWTLRRKPSGSAAALRDARLSSVDMPGVYTVECETDGLWTRWIDLCAHTRTQMFGALPKRADLRLACRSWLNEPGRAFEEIVSRLEK